MVPGGTVCDDRFYNTAARAACKMLGFRSLGAMAFQLAHFGEGNGPILLDNVSCTGEENSLNNCRFDTIHDCSHVEDVGVRCTQRPDVTVTRARLVNGSNSNEGRLEVVVNGTWGTVCDDSFNVPAARVVCRMMGLRMAGAQQFQNAHFGEGTLPILLDDIECDGNERSLDDCQFNIVNDCHHREDVGVRCAE